MYYSPNIKMVKS